MEDLSLDLVIQEVLAMEVLVDMGVLVDMDVLEEMQGMKEAVEEKDTKTVVAKIAMADAVDGKRIKL